MAVSGAAVVVGASGSGVLVTLTLQALTADGVPWPGIADDLRVNIGHLNGPEVVCQGWFGNTPELTFDPDGTLTTEITLFPGCADATIIISYPDAQARGQIDVTWTTTTRSSTDGTVAEGLGTLGTEYRVNHASEMDQWRSDPSAPITFDVDLADAPTTGHVTQLCLYSAGETPHMQDTITINGIDLTAPSERWDTAGDGRYLTPGSDYNSIGLTCYRFVAWNPGNFSNGTNTITVTGQRAIVYAAFIATMPGPWTVPV